MHVFIRAVTYFTSLSIVAGMIAAVVLSHPISRRVTDKDLQSAQQLGIVRNLDMKPLSGWLIVHSDGRRPTVVFLHGRSSNRMQMFPIAKSFFERGYNVVLWDLRHHGNSDGEATYGRDEIPDVGRVIKRVASDPAVDAARIDLLGFSLGAAISIGAASVDQTCTIHAVAADSAYANLSDTGFWYVRLFGHIPRFIAWPTAFVALTFGAWISDLDRSRLNPSEWAVSVSAPTLLIEGEEDRQISPNSSGEIYEKMRSEKELWHVANAGHTEAFYKNPAGYIDRIAAFFSKPQHRTC